MRKGSWWPWAEIAKLKEEINTLKVSVEYWRGHTARHQAAALAAWKELKQQTKGIRRLKKRLNRAGRD